MTKTLVLAVVCTLARVAFADQGSFTNSGGTTQGSSAGVAITSTVPDPSGSLSLVCPATDPGDCSGGSLSYISDDQTIAIDATFTSGSFAESCAGGGKGGHVTCGYSLLGYISGTLTVNGVAQAIVGVTYQGFKIDGTATGTTAYNSAYTPFYYSDSGQILRSDDLQGTNQISYGTQGSDVGQFYGAFGIALDSMGRIYVADTYNSRVVRIDDMNGTNWVSYGSYGSDPGQFDNPCGIAVDSNGAIYVMDTGNGRLVRMDDINGTNWTSYPLAGTSVAIDAGFRIYVPAPGIGLVRMDDMTGANWTVLTQSPPDANGVSQSFYSPVAVALDSAGRIYVADDQYYAPAVVRVDDMTGANWTSIYVSPRGSAGLNSISVDSTGIVYAGGGGARVVDNMAGVIPSSGAIGPYGSYYVFGVTPVTPALGSPAQNAAARVSQRPVPKAVR